jgi:hypothetical protein
MYNMLGDQNRNCGRRLAFALMDEYGLNKGYKQELPCPACPIWVKHAALTCYLRLIADYPFGGLRLDSQVLAGDDLIDEI